LFAKIKGNDDDVDNMACNAAVVELVGLIAERQCWSWCEKSRAEKLANDRLIRSIIRVRTDVTDIGLESTCTFGEATFCTRKLSKLQLSS